MAAPDGGVEADLIYEQRARQIDLTAWPVDDDPSGGADGIEQPSLADDSGTDNEHTSKLIDALFNSCKVCIRSLLSRLIHVAAVTATRNRGLLPKQTNSHSTVLLKIFNSQFHGKSPIMPALEAEVIQLLQSDVKHPLVWDVGPLTALTSTLLEYCHSQLAYHARPELWDAWLEAGLQDLPLEQDNEGGLFIRGILGAAAAVRAVRRLRNTSTLVLGHANTQIGATGDKAQRSMLDEYARIVYSANLSAPIESDDTWDLPGDGVGEDSLHAPEHVHSSDGREGEWQSDGLDGVVRRITVALERIVAPLPVDAPKSGYLSIPRSLEAQTLSTGNRSEAWAAQAGVTDQEQLLLAHARDILRQQYPDWQEEDVLRRTPPARDLIRRMENTRRVPLILDCVDVLRQLEAVQACTRDLPVAGIMLRDGVRLGGLDKESRTHIARAVSRCVHGLVQSCVPLVRCDVALTLEQAQAHYARYGSAASLGEVTTRDRTPPAQLLPQLENSILFCDIFALGALLEQLGSLPHVGDSIGRSVRKVLATKTEPIFGAQQPDQQRQSTAGVDSTDAPTASGVSFLGLCAVHLQQCLVAVTGSLASSSHQGAGSRMRQGPQSSIVSDDAGHRKDLREEYQTVLLTISLLFRAVSAIVSGGDGFQGAHAQQQLFGQIGAVIRVQEGNTDLPEQAQKRAFANLFAAPVSADLLEYRRKAQYLAFLPGYRSVLTDILACLHTSLQQIDAELPHSAPMQPSMLSLHGQILRAGAQMLSSIFSLMNRSRLPPTPEHMGLPLHCIRQAYTLGVRIMQMACHRCRPFVHVAIPVSGKKGKDGVLIKDPCDTCPMASVHASIRLAAPLVRLQSNPDAEEVIPSSLGQLHADWTAMFPLLLACFRDLTQCALHAMRAKTVIGKFMRVSVMERAIDDGVLPLLNALRQRGGGMDGKSVSSGSTSIETRVSSRVGTASSRVVRGTVQENDAGNSAPTHVYRRRNRANSEEYQYLQGKQATEKFREEQDIAMLEFQRHSQEVAPLERARAQFGTRQEELVHLVTSWQTSEDYHWLIGHSTHPVCVLSGLAEGVVDVCVKAHAAGTPAIPVEVFRYCSQVADGLGRVVDALTASYAKVWWNSESFTKDLADRRVAAVAEDAGKVQDFKRKPLRELQQVLRSWVTDRWVKFTGRVRVKADVSSDTGLSNADYPTAGYSLHYSHAAHAHRTWRTLQFRPKAHRDKALQICNNTSEDPSAFLLRVWAETDAEAGLDKMIRRCLLDDCTSGYRLLAAQVLAEQQSHIRDAWKTACTLDPSRTMFIYEPNPPFETSEVYDDDDIQADQPGEWWYISLKNHVKGPSQISDLVTRITKRRLTIQRRDAEGQLIDVLTGFPQPVPLGFTQEYDRSKLWMRNACYPPQFGQAGNDHHIDSFTPDLAVFVQRVSMAIQGGNRSVGPMSSTPLTPDGRPTDLHTRRGGKAAEKGPVASIWAALQPEKFHHEELPDMTRILEETEVASTLAARGAWSADRLDLPWLVQALSLPSSPYAKPPECLKNVERDQRAFLDVLNSSLNEYQAQAVANALLYPVSGIRGPPGCGKTKTLVHMASELHKQGYKVLLVAHANAAIEAVGDLRSSKDVGIVEIAVLRSKFKQMADLSAQGKDAREIGATNGERGKRSQQQLHGQQPMAMTLGLLRRKAFTVDIADEDHKGWALIVDEASQVWDGLLLPAVEKFSPRPYSVEDEEAGYTEEQHAAWMWATRLTKIVVVGDDHQLSPYSEQANSMLSLRSVFDALRDLHEQHPEAVPLVDLRVSYRLPPPIAAATSMFFYSSILHYSRDERVDAAWARNMRAALRSAHEALTACGKQRLSSTTSRAWETLQHLLHDRVRLLWWDPCPESPEEHTNDSWANPDEAEAVASVLALLLFARRYNPASAVILAPTDPRLWASDPRVALEASLPFSCAALAGYDRQTGAIAEKTAESYVRLLQEARQAAEWVDRTFGLTAAGPTEKARQRVPAECQPMVRHFEAHRHILNDADASYCYRKDFERTLRGWVRTAGLAANIDSFQGKEADIILVSLTRTTQDLGFLEDQRRTNVLLTRCKQAMLIVGNATAAYHSAAGTFSTLSRRRATMSLAGQGLDSRMDPDVRALAQNGLHPGLWASFFLRCLSAGRVVTTNSDLRPTTQDEYVRESSVVSGDAGALTGGYSSLSKSAMAGGTGEASLAARSDVVVITMDALFGPPAPAPVPAALPAPAGPAGSSTVTVASHPLFTPATVTAVPAEEGPSASVLALFGGSLGFSSPAPAPVHTPVLSPVSTTPAATAAGEPSRLHSLFGPANIQPSTAASASLSPTPVKKARVLDAAAAEWTTVGAKPSSTPAQVDKQGVAHQAGGTAAATSTEFSMARHGRDSSAVPRPAVVPSPVHAAPANMSWPQDVEEAVEEQGTMQYEPAPVPALAPEPDVVTFVTDHAKELLLTGIPLITSEGQLLQYIELQGCSVSSVQLEKKDKSGKKLESAWAKVRTRTLQDAQWLLAEGKFMVNGRSVAVKAWTGEPNM